MKNILIKDKNTFNILMKTILVRIHFIQNYVPLHLNLSFLVPRSPVTITRLRVRSTLNITLRDVMKTKGSL